MAKPEDRRRADLDANGFGEQMVSQVRLRDREVEDESNDDQRRHNDSSSDMNRRIDSYSRAMTHLVLISAALNVDHALGA